MKLLTTIAFSFFCVAAFSQITQVGRFEAEQKSSDASWTIISMKEKGIALVRDRNKFLNNEKAFEIRILDSLLHEVSRTEVGVSSRMSLIGYEYTGDYVYVLLRSGD